MHTLCLLCAIRQRSCILNVELISSSSILIFFPYTRKKNRMMKPLASSLHHVVTFLFTFPFLIDIGQRNDCILRINQPMLCNRYARLHTLSSETFKGHVGEAHACFCVGIFSEYVRRAKFTKYVSSETAQCRRLHAHSCPLKCMKSLQHQRKLSLIQTLTFFLFVKTQAGRFW